MAAEKTKSKKIDCSVQGTGISTLPNLNFMLLVGGTEAKADTNNGPVWLKAI